ncbi:MAG: hypothetical protein UU32_C0008G0010 [Candidatus Woesebacteria bacterium GW2011_GWB1_41_10]|uniref:Baseplate protein J-like domain-containing protein n=1 Tax=Candidatus Woesebacteria bacterium GW2011_GWB1_41_10 TaxID=1618577 RepID=A0A0G0UHY3_9BACT|nr:MAG: hypothetical protein UU32_C0008G0010 [Candidatus Woesebacteria bacterium GW2011_GWB1_41_10]
MLDFLNKKENFPEAYWAITLEPGFVQAGIWYVKEGKTELLVTSPATPWSEEEDLTESVDTTLSSCVQKLSEELEEPTKTVFGVSSSWVTGGEIKEDNLNLIKKICAELSLTPSGFVVLPEAISHYFKFLEGIPLNAVILGLREDEIELSVFKMGNLVGTTQVARSVSVTDDVVEGLSRFDGVSPLPSRIIIYDGKSGELDEAKNMLSGEGWEGSEKVKFLHTPKIEVLEVEKKVLAVSLAGATEIAGVSQIGVEEEKTPALVDNLGFVIQKEVPLPVKLPKSLKLPEFPKLPKIKLPLVFIVLGAVLLGFFAFWWFYPKATVAIYVSPKSFEEELEVAFGSEQMVATTVSSEKTKNTSGVKLVGEKAKGTVQIRNGTAGVVNLSPGTILSSAGDLKFSLETTASVSAALSPGSPGTTTIQITSGSIGAEYNLAKDETFKVGNYPKAEVDGVATDNFSGGTSREISAVSEDDREKLREELEAELTENAKKELSGKATNDQMFIPELVSLDEKEMLFSHKVGDEADNLKLTLSMDARGVIIDKKQLADSVREKIKDQIPEGFVLRDTQISYGFEFIEEDSNGNFLYKVLAKVNFLPEIREGEIIRKISGRLPAVVEDYLTSIPGFTRAEIRLNPHFPGRFGTLPRVGKHITIEIASE